MNYIHKVKIFYKMDKYLQRLNLLKLKHDEIGSVDNAL